MALKLNLTLLRPVGLAIAASLALGACGNDPDTGALAAPLKTLLSGAGKGKAAPGPPAPAQIAQAMAATDGPFIMLANEKRQLYGLFLKIEQNGAYDTYGTSSRQTLTLKHGMLTASRGLVNDLMSANVDQSLALVSARKPGSTTRVMRYLDGEEQIFAYSFTCTISPGAHSTLPLPVGQKTAVQQVAENCRSESRSFQNTYQVDHAGRIVKSRQWSGPLGGYFEISQLRG
ncbi:YjbF family lipoprotein [Aquicoccus sp. G2-2]|uniref:YjbF family lipoprotein n=1 Tax=Aquicoccus sp. G2-2 TaxID=3092120 RepID=UPI002AE03519|nr:YjbF family lipoprotein [Aquicoccus sp. G2-2]MEA1115088.1 YjbF family lipoprotein [Aquicoccus sp. G2-2]